MKARVSTSQLPSIITLIPENDAERELLVLFANRISRPVMMSARGFKYMDPSVEFYVQGMPTQD